MTTPSVMPAVRSGAGKVRKTLLQLASDVLEIAPADLVVRDGRIGSLDGAIDVPVAEITEKLGDATIDGSGSRGPNPGGFEVHTFGCQIAQVAVDPQVGEVRVERVVAVHDVGRIVNRLGAVSQVEGGVLQGLAFALMEELVVDPTTGVPVNATLDDYKLPTFADVPEIVARLRRRPGREPAQHRGQGPGEPPIIPTAAAIANAFAHATGRAPRLPDDAGTRAGGAPLSGYARPRSLDEALELLADPGAAPLAGGTDLAGQADRGIRRLELLDLQDTGLGEIDTDGDSLLIGAGVTLATLAEAAPLRAYAAVSSAASLAASPLLRNVGTVGGNLCQHTRCWYYRGVEWHCWLGGGETCYAQIGDHRKHGLEPGDCISAHPSDLAPALAACGASVRVASQAGERELPLLELYRRPTTDNRSLLTLGPDELVTAVRLPAPPDASAHERAGERQAPPSRSSRSPRPATATASRSSLPASRTSRAVSTPPTCPGLPGNPQSAWKRDVLVALVERALAATSS